MDSIVSLLIGGALLGIAGSLHCAAMCSGLASGGLMMFAPHSKMRAVLTLFVMMVGRILVYSVLGGLIAASAELTIAVASLRPSMVPMPWIGAVFLVWIGLSTAGFFPALTPSSAGIGRIASAAERALGPARRVPYLAPMATGVVWGLAPCPLVYAALLTAALTGSIANGFVWMLGFGMGTVPAVLLSALGIKALSHVNTSHLSRIASGVAIALFGVATIFLDLPIFSAICVPA